MINQIVIATGNKGKLKEFESMLSEIGVKAYSLADFPGIPEVVEDGNTFAANAIKKAEAVSKRLDMPVIADDSGLEVDYLDGKPGIHSARYAGEEKNDEANIIKLLAAIKNAETSKRSARFVSAIALAIPEKKTIVVHGTVEGVITTEPRGNNGFGYDPIFYLPEYKKTMAEIEPSLKNSISHRSKALEKLKTKIKELYSADAKKRQ